MSGAGAWRISSFVDNVSLVVLEKDELGWKLDVHAYDGTYPRDGDTFQDTIDGIMPFLKKFVDETAVWTDFDSGMMVTPWQALSSVFDPLD